MLLLFEDTAGVNYLLRDEFLTDASAPLTTPRTCEPGTGTLTLVQNDGQLSISGGKLSFPGQTSPANGDQGFYGQKAGGGAFARVAGRVLLASLNLNAVIGSPFPFLGWSRAAAVSAVNHDHHFYVSNSTLLVGASNGANPGFVSAIAAATDYQFAIVLRSSGAYFFIKGGAFTTWTLLWVSAIANTASLYPAFDNYNGVGTMDFFRVYDLPAPFTGELATIAVASPITATDYTGVANAIVDITLAAAGTILTEAGFRFRVVDANNYWRAYFTTAGAFKVDSVVAGVATNRINVAGVAATSATRTIRACFNGNILSFYTLNGTVWTQRGSTLTNATHQSATSIRTDFGADWTATNLLHYEVAASIYSILNNG